MNTAESIGDKCRISNNLNNIILKIINIVKRLIYFINLQRDQGRKVIAIKFYQYLHESRKNNLTSLRAVIIAGSNSAEK